MSDETNVYGGGSWIAIALLIIMFYGDPDLWDALIGYLMAGCG